MRVKKFFLFSALIGTFLVLTACTVNIDVTEKSESQPRDESVSTASKSSILGDNTNEESSISSMPNSGSSANISNPTSSIDNASTEEYTVTLNDGSVIDLTTINQVRYENKFDDTPDITYHVFDMNQEQVQELGKRLAPETWETSEPKEYGVVYVLECLLKDNYVIYVSPSDSQTTDISVKRRIDEVGNMDVIQVFAAPIDVYNDIIEFRNKL